MSTEYMLAPLTASGPLKIAIVGPNKSGKTALLEHFLSHAHETLIEPLEPALSSRSSNPILARLAASRLAFILGRTARLAFSFIRLLQRQRPICVQHDVLPAPDAHPLTFLDAQGAMGLHSLYDDAASADVVLYVTRLDHSRSDRHDKNMFVQLVDVFGTEVLDRLIIVLTRGLALPPLNLTHTEFVRGRSDMLTSFMRLVWPPVVVRPQRKESTDETGGAQDEQGVEDAPLVSGGAIINACAEQFNFEEITFMSGVRRNIRLYPRTQVEEERGDLHPAVRSVVAAVVNDDDTDEGSVSAIPEDFIDPLFEAGVHPDDKRTFEDPATPPFAVVELSHACPTNSNGEKLLPDGTPWFSNLVAKIAKVSEDAPRKAAERIARKEEQTRQPPLNFSSRFREMLRSVSHDAIRLFLIQTVLGLLIWQIAAAIEDAKERNEKAVENDESNVLLEISDEEFEKLTRPDPGSGGQAEIILEPDDDEIDLEESEEDFFRDDKSRRKRKKKREKEQPDPIPLPQMPVPRGSHPVPGLEEGTDEGNSAGSTGEEDSSESQGEQKTVPEGSTTSEPTEERTDTKTEEKAEPPEDSPESEPEEPFKENKQS